MHAVGVNACAASAVVPAHLTCRAPTHRLSASAGAGDCRPMQPAMAHAQPFGRLQDMCTCRHDSTAAGATHRGREAAGSGSDAEVGLRFPHVQ